RTKEWPSAVTEYLIVINQFADSPFVPDARYYLGLSCWNESRPSPYDQDYTQRALTEFERFLELYPDHPRAEEVRRARAQARDRLAKKDYENGRIYLKLSQLDPALFYFRQVQSLYPESNWVSWAKLGEASVYVKRERWDDAEPVLEGL